MKKNLPIFLCGATIVIEGIFLLFTRQYTFEFIKEVTVITLILGALLSFISSLFRQRKQVAYLYLEMHALAMLVYGLSVYVFCNDSETLLFASSFLFFFYAFSEIIFCSWLFNLGRKLIYKIVFIRLILGLVVGIGIVVLISNTNLDKAMISRGFGLLFVLTGINIFLYVPIIKTIKPIKRYISFSNYFSKTNYK